MVVFFTTVFEIYNLLHKSKSFCNMYSTNIFMHNFIMIKVNKKSICGIRNESKKVVRFANIAACLKPDEPLDEITYYIIYLTYIFQKILWNI